MKKPSEPLACTLPEPELRERASEIRQGLARKITATYELDDGIAFRLALNDDSLEEAEAFVAFERRCCPFADFTIRGEDANEALWFEIRCPEGTKVFFEALLAEDRV